MFEISQKIRTFSVSQRDFRLFGPEGRPHLVSGERNKCRGAQPLLGAPPPQNGPAVGWSDPQRGTKVRFHLIVPPRSDLLFLKGIRARLGLDRVEPDRARVGRDNTTCLDFFVSLRLVPGGSAAPQPHLHLGYQEGFLLRKAGGAGRDGCFLADVVALCGFYASRQSSCTLTNCFSFLLLIDWGAAL